MDGPDSFSDCDSQCKNAGSRRLYSSGVPAALIREVPSKAGDPAASRNCMAQPTLPDAAELDELVRLVLVPKLFRELHQTPQGYP